MFNIIQLSLSISLSLLAVVTTAWQCFHARANAPRQYCLSPYQQRESRYRGSGRRTAEQAVALANANTQRLLKGQGMHDNLRITKTLQPFPSSSVIDPTDAPNLTPITALAFPLPSSTSSTVRTRIPRLLRPRERCRGPPLHTASSKCQCAAQSPCLSAPQSWSSRRLLLRPGVAKSTVTQARRRLAFQEIKQG